jgi:hypothetical protein
MWTMTDALGPHFEQESHVILLNFARNSIREVFLRFESAFLGFIVQNYAKGVIFWKEFSIFFHVIGAPRLE